MNSNKERTLLERARWPLVAALLVGVSYPALANAQTAAAPATAAPAATASGDQATNIEEVTVTARRTTERLLDVPVSATALNRAMLDRYQTQDMKTLATQVANLTLTPGSSGSGATLGIRGIASSSTDEGVSQEVTVNIDGVPISRGRVILSSMFDNASVEVLKGPQSLFFGKNSPAGVVTLNSTDPGTSFAGFARVGYDFSPVNEPYLEAGLTVPVNDTFSMRFAIQASNMMGGYVRDVAGPINATTFPQDLPTQLATRGIGLPGAARSSYPGEQSYFGRFTALWRPTDKLRVDFKFLDGDYSNAGPSFNTVTWSCTPGNNRLYTSDLGGGGYLQDPYSNCNPGSRTNSFGHLPAATSTFAGGNGGIPYMHVPMMLGSLSVAYTIVPDVTVTSVTGYYRHDETQLSNYSDTVQDVAFGGPQDEHYRQLDEEVQLVTSFHSPLNFTGGFYFEKENDTFVQNGAIAFLGPDPTTGNWSNYSGFDAHHSTTYSGFGALDWKFAEGFELNGGARYTYEQKQGFIESTFVNKNIQAFGVAAPAGTIIQGVFADTNVSPQVTLSWHVTPQTMLYVAYKTGYKSGGWAGPGIIPSNANTTNERYAPETSAGYEGGLKFSLGQITGDVTIYHYLFQGLQLTAFNTTTSTFFTENAGAAVTDGAEVNLNWQVTDEFAVHGSAAYNRARYSNFQGAQCWADQGPTQGCVGSKAGAFTLLPGGTGFQAFSGGQQNETGMPLAQAPDWAAIMGATYDHPVFGDWKLGLAADLRYKSGYYLSTADSPYAFEKPYATLDATIRLYNHSWEAALIGRNLTDTVYALSGGDIPLGSLGEESATLGNPREILLQLSYKY